MLFDDLPKVLEKVLSPMISDEQNRGYSWNHCYNFFQENHEQLNNYNIKKLACLHLGFYLASWGMYRGSSGLLQKDYTIYKDVIDILLCQNYQDVWQPAYYDDLLSGENEINKKTTKIARIMDLYHEIENYIGKLTSIKNNMTDKKAIGATETLITKIMLGTLACVPAYDIILKKGKRLVKITPSFKTGFPELVERCRKANLLQRLDSQNNGISIKRQNSRITIKINNRIEQFQFPLMKIIDMYLWGIGKKR